MKKENQKGNSSVIELITVIIMSFAYIGIFFSAFISQNPNYFEIIGFIGWVIWLSGLILAFTPNIVFKRHGGVPKGKSYVHTTKLVTDGIYGIIRHPQYTGGLIIVFAMCLILQTPLAYFLAIIAMITTYLSMILEEKRLIVKFGSQYEVYMVNVPRANLLVGLIRKFKKDE